MSVGLWILGSWVAISHGSKILLMLSRFGNDLIGLWRPRIGLKSIQQQKW